MTLPRVSVRSIGAGHWMSPAFQPSGRLHLSVVGSPVPGLTQYECQCGLWTRRSATVNGVPGRMEASDETRDAATWARAQGRAARVARAARAARADARKRFMSGVSGGGL